MHLDARVLTASAAGPDITTMMTSRDDAKRQKIDQRIADTQQN